MRLDIQPQELQGFDLNSFFTDLKSIGKPKTAVSTSSSNMPPVLLAKPNTPSVTAPATPVGSKTFMQTLTNSIQQAMPSIVTVANTAIAIKAQEKLAKLNVQRAAAGEPPIDIATYNEQNAPVIKIQGGVDAGTSKNLMYVGLAIGAVSLVLAMRNRN